MALASGSQDCLPNASGKPRGFESHSCQLSSFNFALSGCFLSRCQFLPDAGGGAIFASVNSGRRVGSWDHRQNGKEGGTEESLGMMEGRLGGNERQTLSGLRIFRVHTNRSAMASTYVLFIGRGRRYRCFKLV